MSRAYNGKDMDQSYDGPGSVNGARKQARDMRYRDDQPKNMPPSMMEIPAERAPRPRPAQPQPGPQPRPRKGREAPSSEPRSGSAQSISRPAQVPQWPLAGPSPLSPTYAEPDFQPRPQVRRPQQSHQKPPRPSQSRIPPVDHQRPQHPTPAFTSRPIAPDGIHDSTIDSCDVSYPSAGSSTQTTTSVVTIPDVQAPAPLATSIAALRKNTSLGPPPSSRRGDSSFYSSTSYVSPIIEEMPRNKPSRSFASSAAMPESSAGESAQMHSPLGDAFYEESLTEKSRESTYDEYGDESQLVRSASMGRKGKPALIHTKASQEGINAQHGTLPLQTTLDTHSYLSAGTGSSETIPASGNLQRPCMPSASGETISSDAIMRAFAAASSSEVKESIPLADAPRQHSRLSAIRRPPRLDIDAVRAAEARGSLTSLPDLILRATRLAAMIDKGKRPASRLDALDGGWMNEKNNRRKSGFSDMLAAFPPPVHTPRNGSASRGSWFRDSTWPTTRGQERSTHSRSPSGQMVRKPKRRCCGLPIWGFILLVFLTLCFIVAAIVVPLEFFVFKNLGNSDHPEPNLSQCQNKLSCLNGGTSLVAQGRCSCICTNGFTGSTCGDGGATGCAMTDLVSTDGQTKIRNVTLGRAIPRLIADANKNYSVPLSGTTILARFNSANLSCIAQNSLVTFDGQSTRSGQPTDEVKDLSDKRAEPQQHTHIPVMDTPVSALAIEKVPGMVAGRGAPTTPTVVPGLAQAITPPHADPTAPSGLLPTTLVIDTSSTTTAKTDPATAAFFEVTEERADFARVAMLFILQEGSADRAIAAQSALQQLFSKVASSRKERTKAVSSQEASNVDLGGGYSIDLVDLTVNVGKGPVGRGKTNPSSSSR